MKPSRLTLCAVLLVPAFLAFDGWMRPPLRARDEVRIASLPAPAPDAPSAVPDQLIVKFRSGADDGEVIRLIREAGGGRMRPSLFEKRYLVTVDAGFTVPEAIRRLRSSDAVEYAEPNGILRAFFRPNDSRFPLQWNFKMIDAERTWDIQKGDASITVAVLDTGIAYEDFGPYRKATDWGPTAFVPGFDFINNDSHPNDDNFHGTHVASTIAEATDNNIGATGLAFQCALMPVKVLDAEGEGSFFAVAEGIDFAARNSTVKVINLSLGGEGTSQAVTSAIDRAFGAGITVVAAAGNDGRGTVSFPGRLPNVIAVGALDGRKQRAFYSNFGADLDMMAPGGDVRRDDTGPDSVPDGQPDGILQQTFDPSAAQRGIFSDFALFWVSGTSQAAPHVAAVAALLIRQGITEPRSVQAAIEQTAQDLGTAGRDDQFGHGLVQPALALKGLGLNK